MTEELKRPILDILFRYFLKFDEGENQNLKQLIYFLHSLRRIESSVGANLRLSGAFQKLWKNLEQYKIRWPRHRSNENTIRFFIDNFIPFKVLREFKWNSLFEGTSQVKEWNSRFKWG